MPIEPQTAPWDEIAAALNAGAETTRKAEASDNKPAQAGAVPWSEIAAQINMEGHCR